jgi:hypothetical protein
MAGRTSLAYLGREDIALSADPEVTYFVEKYTGSSQFSSRIDEVLFDRDRQYFGGETFIQLPRSGDLVTKIYIKIQNPGFGSAAILDSAGTLMINFVDLYIGTQLVERIWGEYIELKQDIEVPKTKQAALASLTGKNMIPSVSNGGLTTYTVDVPFFLLKKGIPICAIEDPVIIRIGFNPASKFTYPPITTAVTFNASLYVENVYLGEIERNFIKSKPHLYLIEFAQLEEFFVPFATGNVATTCTLNFTNPVKEMFFVIQNDSALGYDYSNTATGTLGTTFGTSDQIQNLSLSFNNVDRITTDIGTPAFLRVVQSLEFHTKIQTRLFYNYSFSLDPEGDAPTGHVNFSMVSNQTLKILLNPSTANRNIRVYAVSYSFVYLDRGKATVLFSNYES